MSLSFGCFLICFILSLFLTIYLYFVLHHSSIFYEKSIKFILIGILIIFVRMAIPVNFPFTYTILSYNFLPPVMDILSKPIEHTPLLVIDIMYIFWGAGSIIQFVKLFHHYIKDKQYYSFFCVDSLGDYSYLFEIISEYYAKPIKISIVPEPVSPSIIGFFHPTLILPNIDDFSEEEIRYICIHEMGHLKNHHLWMTLLFEVVCCIQWWNPIIYVIKRDYALFLELSNDSLLLKTQKNFDTLNYAQLLLKVSKTISKSKKSSLSDSLCFITKQRSTIDTRVSFIVDDRKILQANNQLKNVIHLFIIICIVLVSLFIVPESSSYEPGITIEDGTVVTTDNSYLIELEDGFALYLQGEYMGILSPSEMPNDFKELPIYQEGEISNEKQKTD